MFHALVIALLLIIATILALSLAWKIFTGIIHFLLWFCRLLFRGTNRNTPPQ